MCGGAIDIGLDILAKDIQLLEVYLALTVDCDYETSGSVVPNVGVKVSDPEVQQAL